MKVSELKKTLEKVDDHADVGLVDNYLLTVDSSGHVVTATLLYEIKQEECDAPLYGGHAS